MWRGERQGPRGRRTRPGPAGGFLAVQMTMLVPAFIVAEATLSFVGLGFPDPVPSWGTMLHQSQAHLALQTGSPLWSIAPGLCVALLGVSFALLNYAFDEISNPALRPVRRRRVRTSS